MNKIILTYGSVLGIIWIIITYLYMFGHIDAGLTSLLSYGLLIIVFVIASIAYKKKKLSDVSFGKYFKLNAGITLFVSLLQLLFSIGLISTIDEGGMNTIVDLHITRTTELSRSMGMPEEMIEANEVEAYESPESIFSISTQLMGILSVIFLCLILALIVSAVLNKVLKS